MLPPPRAPPPRLRLPVPACGCERRFQEAAEAAAADLPGLPRSVQDWERGSAILEPEPKVPCSCGARRVEVAALAWM